MWRGRAWNEFGFGVGLEPEVIRISKMSSRDENVCWTSPRNQLRFMQSLHMVTGRIM